MFPLIIHWIFNPESFQARLDAKIYNYSIIGYRSRPIHPEFLGPLPYKYGASHLAYPRPKSRVIQL